VILARNYYLLMDLNTPPHPKRCVSQPRL
jgi:hypothetical protein